MPTNLADESEMAPKKMTTKYMVIEVAVRA
jgi:hypothetical protein